MAELYRKFRRLGLNATRAMIGARMLARLPAICTLDVVAYVAEGLGGWSDHMCRTFVRGGYAWPKE